jgi:hypothetical protein
MPINIRKTKSNMIVIIVSSVDDSAILGELSLFEENTPENDFTGSSTASMRDLDADSNDNSLGKISGACIPGACILGAC